MMFKKSYERMAEPVTHRQAKFAAWEHKLVSRFVKTK